MLDAGDTLGERGDEDVRAGGPGTRHDRIDRGAGVVGSVDADDDPRIGGDGALSLAPDAEGSAKGVHDLLGHAAEKEASDGAKATGSHDDEVRGLTVDAAIEALGALDDGDGRRLGARLGGDRPSGEFVAKTVGADFGGVARAFERLVDALADGLHGGEGFIGLRAARRDPGVENAEDERMTLGGQSGAGEIVDGGEGRLGAVVCDEKLHGRLLGPASVGWRTATLHPWRFSPVGLGV